MSSHFPLNILLTHPRTASHLLTQLLSLPTQPHLHRPSTNQDGYFFTKPLLLRLSHGLAGKHISTWSATERREMKSALQDACQEFVNFLVEARRAGRGVYVKEHVGWMVEPVGESGYLFPEMEVRGEEEEVWRAHVDDESIGIISGKYDHLHVGSIREIPNPTFLPPPLLLGLQPTFLIRHPCLVFTSALRSLPDVAEAFAQSAKWEMTLHWQWSLFRWYRAHLSAEQKKSGVEGVEFPIVLDADDVLDPVVREGLMEKYCKATGLDDKEVRWEWERAEVGGLSEVERRMKGTILGSCGVVSGKMGRGLDWDDEREKWKVEFGEEVFGLLEGWVEGSLGAYEDMFGSRLRV